MRKIDAETDKPLVEMILDKAAQKGTGKWTSQAAMDFGVPIPTIDSAVSMRQISAQKEARLLIAEKYGSQPAGSQRASAAGRRQSRFERAAARVRKPTAPNTKSKPPSANSIKQLSAKTRRSTVEQTVENPSDEQRKTRNPRRMSAKTYEQFIEELKNALLSSFIITYAQGMSLLQTASIEKNYDLNLSEIAKIWRGGCIIRSALLEEMRRAYAENPDLPNLILDDKFAEILKRKPRRLALDQRKIYRTAAFRRLCLSSALAYFDAFRSERLPANLIQAQRDFFGAHTYQRIDKEGIFHTPDWNK